MELRHVKSFIAVAEHLSFRSAAKQLYLSQPALTKQVQQLEAEIGVPLFTRQRPHIMLTQAGSAFLERAKGLLHSANFAIEEAKQIESGMIGTVTIGFVSQAAFTILPNLLKKFQTRAPSAAFQLREISAAEQVIALADRTIDFGLIQSSSAPKGYESAVLAQERFAIVHSTQHRLAAQSSVNLKDFAEDTVILPQHDKSADLRETIMANFSRNGGPPTKFQEVARVQTAICLAAANLGIALVPESAKAMRMQGVRFRPLRRTSLPIETIAIWRRKDHSALVNHLKASL